MKIALISFLVLLASIYVLCVLDSLNNADLTLIEHIVNNHIIYPIISIAQFIHVVILEKVFITVDFDEDKTSIIRSLFMCAEKLRLWSHNIDVAAGNDIDIKPNIIACPEFPNDEIFSVKLFAELSKHFTKPIVMRDFFDNKTLLQQWDSKHFSNNFNLQTKVKTFDSDIFDLCHLTDLNAAYSKNCSRKRILSDFIQDVLLYNKKTSKNASRSNYITHALLPNEKFLHDFNITQFGNFTNFLDGISLFTGYFFHNSFGYYSNGVNGGSGYYSTGTPTHCAFVANILVNIEGEKLWTIINPIYEIYLRGMQNKPGGSIHSWMSRIIYNQQIDINNYSRNQMNFYIKSQKQYDNLFNPPANTSNISRSNEILFFKKIFKTISWKEYKRLLYVYNSIPKYSVLLKPGDVLFLPPWWWHVVRNYPNKHTKWNVAAGHRLLLPIQTLTTNPQQIMWMFFSNLYQFIRHGKNPYQDIIDDITSK